MGAVIDTVHPLRIGPVAARTDVNSHMNSNVGRGGDGHRLVFIGVVYILIMEKVGTDILRNAPERGAAPNHQARTIARIVSATIRRNIRAKSR